MISPTPTTWQAIAAQPEFKALLAAKARFIVPTTLFFLIYYFALPVLVGYAPKLMTTAVLGPINLAYLFALSQFFVAWLIAFLYMRAAARFDSMAQAIVGKANNAAPVSAEFSRKERA